MKKLLLVVLLLFLLTGCTALEKPATSGPENSDVESTSNPENAAAGDTGETSLSFEPELAPLSDPQTRSAATGRGRFLETDNGYYLVLNSKLYYADKDNLDLWVLVCSKPDCDHSDYKCLAFDTHCIWMKDGELYGVRAAYEEIRILSPETGSEETVYQEQLLRASGEWFCSSVGKWDGYCLVGATMETDGTWTNRVILLDDRGEQVLFEASYPEQETVRMFSGTANINRSIRGDFVFDSIIPLDEAEEDVSSDWILQDEMNFYQVYQDTLRRINLGEDCQMYGAYIQGDLLYHFHTDDGFYCMDIATGQEKMLEPAGLTSSMGYWVDGCMMLETTLSMSYFKSEADAVVIRYFDGSSWYTLDGTEDWSVQDYFDLVAVTSEGIFFSVRNTDELASGNVVTLCYVALGDTEIFVCGEFPWC